MAEHNILGKEGEKEAVNYLMKHGYMIREINWRCGKKELDIIAEYENELIIIEVKTRKNSNYFSSAHESVNGKKIRRIVSATDTYLKKFKLDLPVRFDIITVIGEKNSFSLEHIVEAFYPPIWK